jgi:hypothetical protein
MTGGFCCTIQFSNSRIVRRRAFSISRRDAPEVCKNLPPKEGVGNAGCPLHPRPRVRFAFGKKHTSIRVHRNRPAFPHAMVLTAYVGLSPVTGLFCHRRLRISFCLSPVGPTQLRQLDASVGASGPHDFAVRESASRQRAVDRSQVPKNPPCDPIARKTLPRPPHPTPRFVTIMIRPSCGVGWREFVEMICPTGEVKYFCKWDSTRPSTTARRANHHTAARAHCTRVPDAEQRSPGDANGSRECAPDDRLRIVRSRCSAEPGPKSTTDKQRRARQCLLGLHKLKFNDALFARHWNNDTR